MSLNKRCPCLHQVWRGNLLTILSCENPSNIWELNYGRKCVGVNQTHGWSGVSSTAEWMNFIVKSWYFSALCFHVLFLEMFRKWFQLSHKTWSHFLFAQHLEAYVMLGLWWTCLRYDIFFLMLETEESISETDNDHILQEASELWSCN